jgi:glutamate synthase (NADPH/NADH) large chain
MQAAIAALCSQADVAVRDGINIIILSDRRAGADRIAIPSLLACAAVHHHLIREGLRTSVGLVVESGEPREVHHFACLAGYGAEAINPYLAFETLIAMKSELPQKLDDKEILKRYIKSIDKGLLKVMSKMGISTYQSYCGAQIFDAVGLKSEFVATFFTGTATRIEGVGLDEIAEEAVRRHRDAFSDAPIYRTMLDVGGDYAVRVRGEDHVWNAATVAALQHAVRGNSYEKYRQYAGIINEQSEHLFTIRGLFRIKSPADEGRAAVPIEEVELAKNIVKRFSTGAMSFGSISREAHTTLAIAMNRIGGKSNTGEGGEEADRFAAAERRSTLGDRSRWRPAASASPPSTVNSDMMQIKIAQGAKPGEGGQLPDTVDHTIAKVRHSTPGVGLISPPPHHDIYSIEDRRSSSSTSRTSTPRLPFAVAARLRSRRRHGRRRRLEGAPDHVTIAGFEGGTGARRSPRSSTPARRGDRLAETHQTLRSPIRCADASPCRSTAASAPAATSSSRAARRRRVRLATAPPHCRRLHHDAQVPSQHLPGRGGNPGSGCASASRPTEHVINYFFFVAEEVRELMAAMGYRTFDAMIARCRCSTRARWSTTGRRAGSISRGCSPSRTCRQALRSFIARNRITRSTTSSTAS